MVWFFASTGPDPVEQGNLRNHRNLGNLWSPRNLSLLFVIASHLT